MEGPGSSGYSGFLEGLILIQYSTCLGALLLSIAFVAPAIATAAEAATRDPFNTGRYLPPSPGVRWQPPFELPRVPDPAAAALPSPDRTLTLPELTEFALQNNPKSRQAWFAARAAAAALGVERSDDFPQIVATISRLRSESGSQTGNQNPWLARYGPAVTLSYLLFDFGAGDARTQAAEYQALAASLAQNRVLQDVVYQVEQAYFRVLGTEQLVRVNELFLKSVSTSLDATRRRREGGLATVADVYRAETQLAQGQLNLTRSRGELEKARGNLAFAVGLPVNAAIRIQMLESAPPIRAVTESLNEMLKRAKLNRPDLVAAEAQARAARASADAASRSTLPTLTLEASTGRTFYERDRPFTDNNSVLFNLRIPIFTGFSHSYTVGQAEARAAQAEASRDSLYRQTELDVWQSYYDMQTAAGGVGTTEAQVKAAQQTAEAMLARYQAGFGSILDLITAQLDETNARVQRIQSYLDWFTAVARLNYSIGASDITIPTSTRK